MVASTCSLSSTDSSHKKIIFSGVQPSGVLHLGNYLGAIKQFVALQNEGIAPESSSGRTECVFCIVDLHAITVPQDPEKLKKNILSVAAMYLACGLDPEKSTIFVQSARSEHSELAWILNCYTYMGELLMMTQFKEKAELIKDPRILVSNDTYGKAIVIPRHEPLETLDNPKNQDKIYKNHVRFCKEHDFPVSQTKEQLIQELKDQVERRPSTGLLNYPVLMAADILLYQTTQVPVGEDQIQHVELTRRLARRFNRRFDNTFAVPELLINKQNARIMGLDDPTQKMSKSASSPANYIALTDDAKTIHEKIKRAVTDSGSEIKASPDKPAITNLLNIFSGISGKSTSELEQEFAGKSYVDFKGALAEAIIGFLAPIQKKYHELMDQPEKLHAILKKGAEDVRPTAKETLRKVKDAVGLY